MSMVDPVKEIALRYYFAVTIYVGIILPFLTGVVQWPPPL